MSPQKNQQFEAFPHDPELVDKLAWRSDVKLQVPYDAFPDSFPTARFNYSLVRDAQTGVRLATTDFVLETGLVVARFIFDAESREEALQRALCVSLAALVTIERANPKEAFVTEFNLGYMFDQREFGIQPASVINELPSVLEAELPHHPIAA